MLIPQKEICIIISRKQSCYVMFSGRMEVVLLAVIGSYKTARGKLIAYAK